MQNYSYHPPKTPEKIFPIFDLGDIVLREKQESDIEDFYRYYADPEVNKFILCEIPQTLEQARTELLYWRGVFYRDDGIYFAIATKEENRLIGAVGLTTFNSYHNRIELSYDLSKEYWRKGIMVRAIKQALKYGFEVMRVNRIEAVVSTDNIASKNLLLKCGFELEGILRQHRYHRGAYVDVYSFSILKNEYHLRKLRP